MKTKPLLLAILLSAASGAPAQLIIYKGTIKAQLLGNGQNQSVKGLGYFIYSPLGPGRSQMLFAYKLKTAKLYEQPSWFPNRTIGTGADSREFSEFQVQQTNWNGSEQGWTLWTGQDIPMPFNFQTNYLAPRMISGISQKVGAFLSQVTVTLSFSLKDTENANLAQSSSDAVLNRYIAQLTEQGYIQGPAGELFWP